MGFMQNVRKVSDKYHNTSVTENGALGYRTTGRALLDLSSAVSSFRNAKPEEIIDKFVKAYYEDRMLALRWLFFAGDVREGLGERRLFRILLSYLAGSHIGTARALLPLIPEYSRWDVVVSLLGTPLGDEAADMIRAQLAKDRQSMQAGGSVSLCAKWLPSENASSAHTRQTARLLAKRLSMTNRQYRQMLSALRSYLDIVEIKMSDGRWGEIAYEAVPSRANLVYNKAFLRNDEERRREFLGAVKKGEKSVHAGVLYPHDIVHSYQEAGTHQWSWVLRPVDDALEELWRALPDYVQGAGNTLCIADGSGSMTTKVGNTQVSCLDVANALAIYFAEHCTGQFRDLYITFSERPQFVDLSQGHSLHDKIEIALHHDEVANTNIEAVFELILDAAVKTHMTQEDFPENILILSDMEFDVATRTSAGNGGWAYPDEKLFDTFARRYAQHGYRLPRLVFWNICSRTQTIPIRENALGVALVSGFSPVNMRMVLSNELDPFRALTEQLMVPRYDAVERALQVPGKGAPQG